MTSLNAQELEAAARALDPLAFRPDSCDAPDCSFCEDARDEARECAQAAVAAYLASAWQDISTAPKDGTPVDLFSIDRQRRWTDYRWDKEIITRGGGAWSKASYASRPWRDRPFVYGMVTHWMPKPTPPSADQAAPGA